MSTLRLRPIADDDYALVEGWLKLPHIAKWFPDGEGWLHKIRERHGTYAWTTHFLIVDGETPVGLCQYYDWFHYGKAERWYTIEMPGHTFSFDYLIGDETYLGKGHGKEIVGLLTDAIRQEAKGQAIVLKPEADNEASKRAIKANGYEFQEDGQYFIKYL